MSAVDFIGLKDAAGDQALVTTAGELQVLDSQSLTEQKELAIIAEAIQELVSRLDFLPSVRGIAADLRVTLLSGTVTSVTTVGTVSNVTTVSTVTSVTTLANQTNIGGFAASGLVQNNQNNLAIISNIQNIL
jgi:hypothetical protein